MQNNEIIEIWKDILDYENRYQISNLGNIKSLYYNNTLMPQLMIATIFKNGYYRIDLSKNNVSKLFSVHRLVALAFIPNSDNKPEVNHKNGIKTDNFVDNLEWTTKSENRLHAFKIGLQKASIVKGERNGTSKLTQVQVDQIRSKYIPRKYTLKILAKEYNMCERQIWCILKRKFWK